jgi:hypothetical protein
MALESLNTLRLRETQTEKARYAGIAACEAEEELNGRRSARLTWVGRRFARSAAMFESGVNHEWFGWRQEKGSFREEKGNQREGRLLLARQLKLMVRRRMRLMLTVVVLVIFPVLVIIVVVCRMCAGR